MPVTHETSQRWFLHLYMELLCLCQKEKNRVKGFIINKFRGDVELLKPGIK